MAQKSLIWEGDANKQFDSATGNCEAIERVLRRRVRDDSLVEGD